MIVQCENCGAPLDVKGSEMHVTCSYCGRNNQVRKMKTLHAINPAGWAPPPVWTPPPQISTTALRYAVQPVRRGTNFLGCFVGLIVLGSTLIAVGIPLYQEGMLGFLPGFGWDGSEPFRCGSNDSVRIHDVHANLPRATAITVEANCEVEIVDSEIVAWEGIRADGNRGVVLRNSTIRATGIGIRASGNKSIELDQSTVIAGGIGIQADGIAHVVVAGGRVVGSPEAVTTSAAASFENRGAAIINGTMAPGSTAPVAGDACERARLCCDAFMKASNSTDSSTCNRVQQMNGAQMGNICEQMIDGWRQGIEALDRPIPLECQ